MRTLPVIHKSKQRTILNQPSVKQSIPPYFNYYSSNKIALHCFLSLARSTKPAYQ
jgi:hypothetical protein